MKTISIPSLGILFLLNVMPAVRAADAPRVDAIRVPNDGVSSQARVDARNRLHLIYFKGDARRGDIYYVYSDDGAKTFSDPVRVNSQSGSALIIGSVRAPHLALGRGGRPMVAWLGSELAQPKVVGKKAPMLFARLTDAGNAFDAQRNVIASHAGLDGGGSIAADANGNVYVAWHAPDGAEGEVNRRVWLARSTDDGKTFAAEEPVVRQKTGACGCCALDLGATDDGVVALVYRSCQTMSDRDIHILISDDFGKTFERAAVDPWHIGMCVMSAAAVAPGDNAIALAWEAQDHIRTSLWDRRAKHLGSIASLSAPGKLSHHPAVAFDRAGNYIVAWTEGTDWNKGGSVAWQVFNPRGEPMMGGSGHAAGLPVWDTPAVFATAGGFAVMY